MLRETRALNQIKRKVKWNHFVVGLPPREKWATSIRPCCGRGNAENVRKSPNLFGAAGNVLFKLFFNCIVTLVIIDLTVGLLFKCWQMKSTAGSGRTTKCRSLVFKWFCRPLFRFVLVWFSIVSRVQRRRLVASLVNQVLTFERSIELQNNANPARQSRI